MCDELKSPRCPITSGTLLAVSFLRMALFVVQVDADAKRLPPAHSVDLNSATADESQQVSGIGLSAAKAIVNVRPNSGPFRKIDDLLAVKSISKRGLEKMRPYCTST